MGINEVIGETFGIVAEWLCSESHVSCCLKTKRANYCHWRGSHLRKWISGRRALMVSITQVVDK